MTDLNVVATKVDDIHIQFECPRCVYRNRPVIHYHGSCGEFHNRVENRVAHCDQSRIKHYPDVNGFNIHITDATVRPRGKSRIYPTRPSPLTNEILL
jgi:hypothetical protein